MNKINRDPLATGPAPCAVANGRGDPIFALFDGGVRSLDNGESSQNYPTRRVTNNVGGVIQGTGIGSIGIGFGTTQGIVTIINSGTISGATGIGLGTGSASITNNATGTLAATTGNGVGTSSGSLTVTGGPSGYDTHRTALLGSANGSTDGGNLNALIAIGYDWKKDA